MSDAPDVIANESPEADHAHAHNGSSVNQFRFGGSKREMWLAILLGISTAGTFMMFAQWRIAEREARMLEYYVMELDGKLMASGIIKYPESWSARKGERK